MPTVGDGRLLRGELAQALVERLAAGGRAAGGIDGDDHALDRVVLGELVEQLVALAVVGDEAGDGHARDLRLGEDRHAVAAGDGGDAAADDDEHGEEADDAPERELSGAGVGGRRSGRRSWTWVASDDCGFGSAGGWVSALWRRRQAQQPESERPAG